MMVMRFIMVKEKVFFTENKNKKTVVSVAFPFRQ